MKRLHNLITVTLFIVIPLSIAASEKNLPSPEKNTDEPGTYLNIARYHMAIDEYSKAIQNYEHYLKANPDERVTVEYVHALFWMGRIEKCLDVLHDLIRREGRKTELLLENALILAHRNRFKQAINLYREILEKEPDNLSAHLGLSYIYLKSPEGSAKGKEYRSQIKSLREKFKFALLTDIKKTQQISRRLDYKKSVSSGFDRNDAILELAFLKRNIAQYDESISYFNQYLSSNDDPKVRFELAKTYSWAKRPSPAIKELKKILKKDKDNLKVIEELALYESWAGRWQSAEKRFQYLLSLDPSNITLKFRRADNLKWAGKTAEAFDLYKEILDQDPKNKKARKGLIETSKIDYLLLMAKKGLTKDLLLKIHNTYIPAKRYEEDVKILSQYLTKHPDDVEILTELSKTYVYMNEINKAIVTCERILSVNKDDNYGLQTLPILYLWFEQFDKSAESFKKLESKKGLTTEQRLQFAEALQNSHDKESASYHYFLILKKDPKNEKARNALLALGEDKFILALFNQNPLDREITEKLSSQYITQNKIDDAETVLKKHFEVDPLDIEAIHTLARVLSWEGKFDESLSYYELLLKNKNIQDKSLLLMESANVLAWKGEYKKAERRYKDALAKDPQNLDKLTGLSKIYMWSGQREKEKETYEKILKINPANMYSGKMLARAENDPSYRIAKLELKLLEDPNDTKTMRELLPLYEQTEDFDKATLIASRLTKKYPEDAELKEKYLELKEKSSQNALATMKSLKEEMAQKPFARQPRKRYVAFLIASGKNEDAIREMNNYLLLYPEDYKVREDLAKALSWEGRYTESLNEYESLLMRQPANNDYKISMAEVLSWSGVQNYPLALKLTNEVIASDPKNKEAYLIRGNIYNWSENYSKALKDYRTILDLHETNMDAQAGISSILKTRYNIDLGFLFRKDNDSFSELAGLSEFALFWSRRFDSRLSYSHSLYTRDGNPDVNADHLRFTQGVRLSDTFFLDAFTGLNEYWSIGKTLDYGSHLKYSFGLRDFISIGYENTDVLVDTFTYGSISPDIIDSDNIVFNCDYYPTNKLTLNLNSKIGFYSDTNRLVSNNLVLSYLVRERKPLVSVYGSLYFLRLTKRLYASSRYWDPPYYIDFVPGVYLEAELARSTVYFVDLRVGYGNEDGSSALIIGVDSGFVFTITGHLKTRLEGFYSQTGRSIASNNYYWYGAKALLSFDF